MAKKILILLISVSIIFAREKKPSWFKLARRVDKTRISTDFRDSLVNFYGINTDSLRVVTDRTLPFKKHEIMVYEGGWEKLNAGYGIIESTVDTVSRVATLTGTGVTNNFVSSLYRVRDFVVSEYNIDGLYPIFNEQHISENRYKKESWVLFDHKNSRLFTNKKRSEKTDELDTLSKYEYPVTPFTNDYISLLFYIRTINYMPNDTFSANCFVHGKDQLVHFVVHNKDTITVKAGTFNCIKVEPKLVGKGRNFTEKDKMMLWFTDDKRKIMVKATSKVKLGFIIANLIHYESE